MRAAGRFDRPASSGKEMTLSKNIYIEAFENYRKIGMDPLPIPYEDGHPRKGPKIAGWQTKAANGQYSDDDFAEPCNIGILLGGPKNLTDIDCDSPEAVLMGSEVMKGSRPESVIEDEGF
jgi:hypothetical protein